MKFSCENCNTKYSIADERVKGRVLKIRCKACNHTITVSEKPAARADATVAAPAPGGSPAGADWFVSFDGNQEGPHTLSVAQDRVRAEMAGGKEAHAWKMGFADWLPVAQVPEFAAVADERRVAKPIRPSSQIPTTRASSLESAPLKVSAPVSQPGSQPVSTAQRERTASRPEPQRERPASRPEIPLEAKSGPSPTRPRGTTPPPPLPDIGQLAAQASKPKSPTGANKTVSPDLRDDPEALLIDEPSTNFLGVMAAPRPANEPPPVSKPISVRSDSESVPTEFNPAPSSASGPSLLSGPSLSGPSLSASSPVPVGELSGPEKANGFSKPVFATPTAARGDMVPASWKTAAMGLLGTTLIFASTSVYLLTRPAPAPKEVKVAVAETDPAPAPAAAPTPKADPAPEPPPAAVPPPAADKVIAAKPAARPTPAAPAVTPRPVAAAPAATPRPVAAAPAHPGAVARPAVPAPNKTAAAATPAARAVAGAPARPGTPAAPGAKPAPGAPGAGKAPVKGAVKGTAPGGRDEGVAEHGAPGAIAPVRPRDADAHASLTSTINQAKRGLNFCYDRMVKATGMPRRVLVKVHVKVGAAGAVNGVSFGQSTGDSDFDACISNTVKRMSFAAQPSDHDEDLTLTLGGG